MGGSQKEEEMKKMGLEVSLMKKKTEHLLL